MNYQVSERRIRNNKLRRRRQLKNNIMKFVLTLMLISCLSVCFFSFKTKAQSNDAEISYKYYKSISVNTGDTLWDYAAQYADEAFYDSYESYINEVININALSDDSIISGQSIIIPYYSKDFIG
ncbi:MAG: LysM peptidoglycan-binding domain-containing protein [Lachnospiraceae bacterium]|nr:LysM peptidoglycan-binding domain-containing protein [Lachnospiraceae bacterium]